MNMQIFLNFALIIKIALWQRKSPQEMKTILNGIWI